MNLSGRFQSVLHSHPNKKILGYKQNKKWNWVTRNELKNKVLYCVDVLKNRNVKLNDRIMYKGNNSVNWAAWSIATNSLGGIFVPLYQNQNEKYVYHIIEDCDPKLFITNSIYKNVDIFNDHIEDINSNEIVPVEPKSDISKLIYTSGTTGKPKGVMLTHENILHNIQNIEKRFHDLRNDREYTTLSILPWAHIYGLTTELYYNMLNNNKIAISSGPEKFVKEIGEIQPDMLYLVPRVLQMIKKKIEKLDKPFIRCILPFILRKIFGGNLLTIFIGGSQLDASTKNFYNEHNINICEGYGCTETSPMISVNHISNPRNIESVGMIMDDLIVEIINNEICVHGPSVMKGYYNNIEATNNAFVEKDNKLFYKTGDEGYVKDGFIFYQGRISENYKLSNGKFVNVNEVENIIKKYVSDTFMIYGSNKNYNIIIVEGNSTITNNTLNNINHDLDGYLHVKKILRLKEGDLQKHLTPKMSLKRKDVESMFEKEIEKMYL